VLPFVVSYAVDLALLAPAPTVLNDIALATIATGVMLSICSPPTPNTLSCEQRNA